jgi:hypothetical protein
MKPRMHADERRMSRKGDAAFLHGFTLQPLRLRDELKATRNKP